MQAQFEEYSFTSEDSVTREDFVPKMIQLLIREDSIAITREDSTTRR